MCYLLFSSRTHTCFHKCAVLYCTVLYCTVLNCTVLSCTVLHCTVLHCTALYCTVSYCTVKYCIVLYCTVLSCTVLYCTVLLWIKAQRCIKQYCMCVPSLESENQPGTPPLQDPSRYPDCLNQDSPNRYPEVSR